MNKENHHDVIVIGGGPAGCASAIFLSRKGYRVLLLDQARFPRDKVCGEFISPAADDILSELGVLESIEATSPSRLRGVSISAYEKAEMMVEYPPAPGTGKRMTSLSLPRIVFDNLMLQQVRREGVEVREQHKVTDLNFQDGRVTGVRGRDEDKTSFTLRAAMVVDAGGRNCISLRKLGLKVNGGPSIKIAVAAHWDGVSLQDPYCFMHISRPGYTGIAPVGDRLANVVLVVDRCHLDAGDLQEFYRSTVLKNQERRKLLAGGEVAEKVRVVESLAYSVKPLECGGLLLVGDATGFIDPFTGEGIYLSLKSARIASGVIDTAFRKRDFSVGALAVYERLRHREFHRKFLLSKILQRVIYKPALAQWVIRTLADNPRLAETLVGVMGDYVPTDQAVSLSYLLRFLLAGAPTCVGKQKVGTRRAAVRSTMYR